MEQREEKYLFNRLPLCRAQGKLERSSDVRVANWYIRADGLTNEFRQARYAYKRTLFR